ncbi:hypothetical protein ACHWQZ_G018063 [Mnemiopsis leidyi]
MIFHIAVRLRTSGVASSINRAGKEVWAPSFVDNTKEVMLLILLSLFAISLAEDYDIKIKTSDCWFCSTRNDVYITFIGRDGKEVAYPEPLDNEFNNFESGEADWFHLYDLPRIWYLKCIKIKVTGTDKWKFDEIQVGLSSDRSKKYIFPNRGDVWMSADPEEGLPELKICVTECDEYLPVRNSKWELEKVVYNLEESRLTKYTPEKVGEQHIDNTVGTTSQSTSFVVEETVTETSYFAHSADASVTVGTQFSAGVPYMADGEISIDVTASYGYSWGEEKSVQKKMAATYNCVAPAGKAVNCRALLHKARIEVPYTQVWKHKWKECSQEVSGSFKEVSAVNLQLDITEE